MDFQTIIQEKYLTYFLCDREHKISDTVMVEFLDDMIALSERMDPTMPPTEIIKEIMKRCGLEDGALNGISLIASSDLIETLNAFEVFALLWYVTCRNAWIFEEAIYLSMANNQTIGNLLKRLSEFPN